MSSSSFFGRILRPFTTGTTRLNPVESAQRPATPEGAEKCVVAAGCFWGVEHEYRKQFAGHGLLDARVGYIGGGSKQPTYEQVCRGTTGHAEALQVIYDPEKLSYRQLIEFFYRMHDPTQLNRQGNDRGTQYRSAIFYYNDEQKSIAQKITELAQKRWWKNGKIATDISPAGEWWDAESYHQRFLEAKPGYYTCESHFIRTSGDFATPLED